MIEQSCRKRCGKNQNFLTCFISLLIYRLLEKKLPQKYTCEEILSTLRGMRLTPLTKESGYIPSYKRTDLTDDLHKVFGFHTDYEFIPKATMLGIIKYTKKEKQKNSTYRFQKESGYNPHKYWVAATFSLSKVSNSKF